MHASSHVWCFACLHFFLIVLLSSSHSQYPESITPIFVEQDLSLLFSLGPSGLQSPVWRHLMHLRPFAIIIHVKYSASLWMCKNMMKHSRCLLRSYSNAYLICPLRLVFCSRVPPWPSFVSILTPLVDSKMLHGRILDDPMLRQRWLQVVMLSQSHPYPKLIGTTDG